jgi:hypothetical protein
MLNVNQRKSKLGSKNDPRTFFAQMGWEDARLGRPFRYDISTNVALAGTYENARLRVLTLRENGLPVPAWNAAHTVPPKIRAAIETSSEIALATHKAGGLSTIPFGPKGWLPVETGA